MDVSKERERRPSASLHEFAESSVRSRRPGTLTSCFWRTASRSISTSKTFHLSRTQQGAVRRSWTPSQAAIARSRIVTVEARAQASNSTEAELSVSLGRRPELQGEVGRPGDAAKGRDVLGEATHDGADEAGGSRRRAVPPRSVRDSTIMIPVLLYDSGALLSSARCPPEVGCAKPPFRHPLNEYAAPYFSARSLWCPVVLYRIYLETPALRD